MTAHTPTPTSAPASAEGPAVRDVLAACLDDLHHPERITTGALGRDAGGNRLFRGQLDRAVCWCGLGLIGKYAPTASPAWLAAYGAISDQLGTTPLTVWFDHATPAERIRVFKAALASVGGAA